MRIAATLGLVAAALAALGCEPATAPLDYDDFEMQEGDGEFGAWVQAGLYSRTYYLHTPPNMSETERYPLLIALHGAGGTGESFHRTLRSDAVTDAAGYVTVFPDGMENTWTVGCGECTFAEALKADDISFLQTLTRQLAENLPIDTTRVYVMGYSQGGSLAHLYACESSIPPAGIASVASLVYKNVRRDCAPAGNFPVAIVHGTFDPMAYYQGYGVEAPLLSVPDAVDMWVGEMRCDPTPSVSERPDTADDFTTITVFQYDGCSTGSSVVHYRVNGAGHNWPGDTGPWSRQAGLHSRNMDATKEILEFWESVGGGG
jgi:polyhydroxybutyrate depolymerase